MIRNINIAIETSGSCTDEDLEKAASYAIAAIGVIAMKDSLFSGSGLETLTAKMDGIEQPICINYKEDKE
jgi:hypothetical protein